MEANVELESKGLSLVEQARGIVISTQPQYESACHLLLDVKDGLKECDKAFDDDIKRWYDGHKAAIATKARYQAPFKQVEAIIKPKISAYMDEQARLRREAEAKAQQEAQLAAAVEAESAGDAQQAEEILNGQGTMFVPPVMLPPAAKVAGVSSREVWRAEVVDLMALIRAVASGQVPSNVLEANTTVLGGLARSLKGNLRIPGVRPVCEKAVAAGRR